MHRGKCVNQNHRILKVKMRNDGRPRCAMLEGQDAQCWKAKMRNAGRQMVIREMVCSCGSGILAVTWQPTFESDFVSIHLGINYKI
jgi:hypothetical protein